MPSGLALSKLAADYQHMVDDGLFLNEVESFDALLNHCQAIQEKANAIQDPADSGRSQESSATLD